MESTNQQQAYQVQLRHVLDTHLAPFLKAEWKDTLSFYDAGAQPSEDGEGLSMVVVWLRSTDIVRHVSELLKRFEVDLVERIPGVGTGEPRLEDSTLMVRLYSKASDTDLVVHIFQAFGEHSEEDSILDELRDVCSKKPLLN